MRRKYPKSGMWDYLDSIGVLKQGTDEELKAAKKAYRKTYFLQHKRLQRANKHECTTTFSKGNGDYGRVALAAKRHKRTLAAFVRVATLAYISNTYIVPDAFQIARLEQLLSQCLNEIKTIIKPREKYFWERERRFELIERRISKLETDINEVLRNPPLLMSNDHKNQIA